MPVTILISADDLETRAAFLESGHVMDFEVEREERIIGNIYKGRVNNVLAGMDAAFVEVGLQRTAFIYVTDVTHGVDDHEVDHSDVGFGSIKEALNVGQEVLVQVVRPGVGAKGPRVSTRLSLPGRYCVLLVHGSQQLGVSRKIASEDERRRLHRLAERVRPFDCGLIIRTEAEGKTERELQQDVQRLGALWQSIEHRTRATGEPGLIHRDLGLLGRIVRDWLHPEVERIIIDAPELHAQVLELLRSLAPEYVERVALDSATPPLFERFGIEQEIALALEPTINLHSGGFLVFSETEAMTTVDVNTGRFVGKTRLADTVLTTNVEAASEIARQLRMRDIGGIVVIDFIDMDHNRDRVRVMDTLEAALRFDRARTRIISLSPLGLVEMTRRREGRSLSQMLKRPCPTCRGTGLLKSAATVAMETRRTLRRLVQGGATGDFVVTLAPEAAATFVGLEGVAAQVIERDLGRQVFVRVNPYAHVEKIQVAAVDQASLPPTPALEPGAQVVVRVAGHTYPHDDNFFGVFERMLMELTEEVDPEIETVRRAVREVNRWYIATAPLG